MIFNHYLKLVLVFSISLSLISLTGATNSNFRLPTPQLVHGITQPCQVVGSTGACSEFWYPSGPEMDNELATISSASSQNACLQNTPLPPCLDFTDSPASSAEVSACLSSQTLYLTASVPGGSQFCYLRCQTSPCSTSNSWTRAINDATVGLPNYFTWLNAWNPAPGIPNTIRQGFSTTTRSINPYIASTVQDSYVVGNVYDSLYTANPLSTSEFIDWMTLNTFQLSNSSLSYQAPAHTATTYRFTLRSDLYFQDARRVTAYDVAFSYMSMVGSGAFLGRGGIAITGITILASNQFDVGVNSLGPFVLPNLTSVPILPGRYWTNAGSSAWDTAVASCTGISSCSGAQYFLSGSAVNCGPTFSCASFPTTLLAVNPADTAVTFDPIANHIFVGSGPWECGVVTSIASGVCTSTGQQNPPLGGSYSLSRFGIGLLPASSLTGIYFRSSGNTALWIWSGMNGDLTHDFLLFSQAVGCFGKPINPAGSCGPLQRGIGNIGGGLVGINQITIEARFFGVNWVAPFDWRTSPPLGIGPFPPVLYDGTITLSPCSIDPVNGYDC